MMIDAWNFGISQLTHDLVGAAICTLPTDDERTDDATRRTILATSTAATNTPSPRINHREEQAQPPTIGCSSTASPGPADAGRRARPPLLPPPDAAASPRRPRRPQSPVHRHPMKRWRPISATRPPWTLQRA